MVRFLIGRPSIPRRKTRWLFASSTSRVRPRTTSPRFAKAAAAAAGRAVISQRSRAPPPLATASRLHPNQTLHLPGPSKRTASNRRCPLSELVQDARYAVRTLLRSPGFTSVAVLTLALGIGANSAIFSFVDGVLLKPLPYRDPQQIVLVWEKPPAGVRNVISTMNFLDWKQGNTVFEHIAATSGTSMTLSGVELPVLLRGGRVSASYFEVFGVEAAFGRTFAPDEDELGKDHVIVLSHRLWSSQFGSDPALVGKTVTLDSEPYTVIGVLPEGSAFDRGG